MKIVAVCQQKGGCGKTTSVLNLAALAAMDGYRTLAIDCDPQANLTMGFGFDPQEDATGSMLILRQPPATISTQIPGLDLCPTTSSLAAVEAEIFSHRGRESRLLHALEKVDPDRWDLIILDTPPNLNLLTVNCLVAADQVLIPVKPSFFDLGGVGLLRDTIQEIRDEDRLNPRISIAGVFVTLAEWDNATKDAKQFLEEDLGDLFLSSSISRRADHKYAASGGSPAVVEYSKSPAAKEYVDLWEECRSRLGLTLKEAAHVG